MPFSGYAVIRDSISRLIGCHSNDDAVTYESCVQLETSDVLAKDLNLPIPIISFAKYLVRTVIMLSL